MDSKRGFIKPLKWAIGSINTIIILTCLCVYLKPYFITKSSINDTNQNNISLINKGKACSTEGVCLDAVIIYGDIDISLEQAIQDNLGAIKNTNLLCLLSGGGSGKTMVNLSRVIRENNIPICLADKYIINKTELFYTGQFQGKNVKGTVCASACGFLLMSAKERVYVGNGRPLIGLHTPIRILDLCLCDISLGSMSETDQYTTDIINEEPDNTRKSDIKQYLSLSHNTESGELYFLTKTEIEALNVFNKIYK